RFAAVSTAAVFLWGLAGIAQTGPPVTPPPDAFFEMVREGDREAARAFYKKYLDLMGMPVVAAEVVADLALQRASEIVTRMLAGRPDVVAALVKNQMYLIVIGRDQVYGCVGAVDV